MAKKKIILIGLLLLASWSLAAAGESDREAVLQEQKALSARIAELQREQDFLVFQKTAAAMDSKYLVLNLAAGTGQLKYKTRVLKDFSFIHAAGKKHGLKQGTSVLTMKIDGPKRYGLIFGKELILRGKKKLTSLEADILPLSLDKKDLMAIFYALEPGARAYILP